MTRTGAEKPYLCVLVSIVFTRGGVIPVLRGRATIHCFGSSRTEKLFMVGWRGSAKPQMGLGCLRSSRHGDDVLQVVLVLETYGDVSGGNVKTCRAP